MVSAGIAGTFINSVDSSASVSKNSKNNDCKADFAKLFENQTVSGKNSGNEMENTEISSKSQEIQAVVKKFYTEKNTGDSMPDSGVPDEACMENISVTVFSQIINTIAQNLNCSEDEVKQAMNDLEIGAGELLDNQNVSKIICELSGIDDTANILTDEKLTGLFKSIYSEIQEIVDDFKNATGVDDIALKEMLNNITDSVVKENTEVIDNVIKADENSDETVDDNFAEKDIADEQNGVKETVVQADKENINSSANQEKDFTNNNERNSKDDVSQNGMYNIIDTIKETIVENISGDDTGIAERIIKQITDDVKLYAKPDMTSLEIQLEPEALGKVSLTVASKAGSLTAQLTVQNEVAREAIESQMSSLKESLNNQGIKVDAIEVTLASKEFEQNLEKEGNSDNQNENRHKKHISAEELDEINGKNITEETVMDTVMKEMGNTVSYSA